MVEPEPDAPLLQAEEQLQLGKPVVERGGSWSAPGS